MKHSIPGSPFPDAQQALLLKAALLSDHEALAAWDQWGKNWDIDGYLDHGSFRLLPLLYRNLAHHKVDDPRMVKLKGVYRQAWCKNVKLFHDAVPALTLFLDGGIPTMLLKGVPLSLQYYKDSGVRPMADIDLMIPRKCAPEGISLLKKAGWKAEFDAYIEYNLQYGRSMMFSNSDGFELDLHWHPFFESRGEEGERDLWDKSAPLDFLNLQTLALCPADQLLHVIIHGLKWNPEPPIRWVADAMAILSSDDQKVEWERFLQQVIRYKVVVRTREAFGYLVHQFHAAVPDAVMSELNAIPVTFAEKMIYKHDQKNPEAIPSGFFRQLKYLGIEYLRQSEHRGSVKQLFGFVKYLYDRTKGKNYLRILGYYLTQSLRCNKPKP